MNNLHVRHTISMGLSIFGAGLALLGSSQNWPVCMWVGFALMFVAIGIGLTVRCPNCGHNLVRRRFTLPKFCPECGQAIDGSEIEE